MLASPTPPPGRYVSTVSAKRPVQQRRTCASTDSRPSTQRYVSYWPAKLAPARSSATPLERTATGTSAIPVCSQSRP
jgi:hypothetical protein